jgi:hypothetical protein
MCFVSLTKAVNALLDSGQDGSMVCYDIRYALRLCRERNLTEACVQLSALLGLWESAVDLALTVDVKLAKQTATLPQNDPELRKKLWLKIGKFALSFALRTQAVKICIVCLATPFLHIVLSERPVMCRCCPSVQWPVPALLLSYKGQFAQQRTQ